MTEKRPYDTRKHPRLDANLVTQVQYANLDEFISQYSVNISQGGVFIQSREVYPKGTPVNFEIQLKGGKSVMRGKGVVAWTNTEAEPENGPPGMGVKFVAMDKASKAILKKLVESKKRTKKKGHTTGDFSITPSTQTLDRIDQLVGIKSPRKIIEKATSIITDRRGFFNAWAALLDESEHYSTHAESQVGKRFDAITGPLGAGALPDCAKKALKTGTITSYFDPPEACPNCPLAEDYAQRGALCMPLIHGGHSFGFLVASTDQHTSLDTEERSLFKAFARTIALALYEADDQVKSRIRDLEKGRSDLEQKLSQLKKLRTAAQDTNKQLKSKLNRLMEENGRLAKEQKKLSDDIDRVRGNYTAANKANQALEARIKKALEDQGKTDAENKQLQKELKKAAAEVAKLEQDVASAQENHAASASDKKALYKELSDAKTAVEDAQSENAKLTDKLKRAKAKVLGLEDRNSKQSEQITLGKDKLLKAAHSYRDLTRRTAQLRKIADSQFDDPFIAYTFSGEICAANTKACRLVGYGINDLLGSDIEIIDKLKGTKQQNAKLVDAGALVYDTTVKKKNGDKIPVSVNGKVIATDAEGLILAVVTPKSN